MRLADQQLGVLRHALGLDPHGHGICYRNHFVAGIGHDDQPTCQLLVELGLMIRHRPSELSGGSDVFSVTTAGRAAAVAEPARLSRSQQRYRRWLDADTGLTFEAWLKAGHDRMHTHHRYPRKEPDDRRPA